MALSPQHSVFPVADPRFASRAKSRDASPFTVSLNSILLALLCVVSTACGTAAPTGKILFQDPRGTVSLQTIPDRSIQATHPIALEPALIAQILNGMTVQYQERGIQKLLSGASSPVPVFSDEQIKFLAPLIAEGLRTAAPDQRIGYRVQTTHKGTFLESSTTETTAGSLYAYGRQLYVILSQYRSSPTRANLNIGDMANRSRPLDYSGLRNHILLFTPSAAQRSDSFDQPEGEKPTDRFLAVDYQLLQQAWQNLEAKRKAAPQAEDATASVGESLEAARAAEVRAGVAEAQARAAEAQARAAEAQARNTEALAQEVETLKKQLESIQKQLGKQPTR